MVDGGHGLGRENANNKTPENDKYDDAMFADGGFFPYPYVPWPSRAAEKVDFSLHHGDARCPLLRESRKDPGKINTTLVSVPTASEVFIRHNCRQYAVALKRPAGGNGRSVR